MQKKPNQGKPPSRPDEIKKASNIPARPPAPQIRKAANVPPVRPMVTAQQRRELKDVRRAAPVAPPATPPPAPSGAPPADPIQLEVNRLNSLQDQIHLTQVNDDLEDLHSAVGALPANLENIRSRGYVFKSYLERKVETLATQWRDVRPKVEQAARTAQAELSRAAGDVQARLSRRQSAAAALSALEGQVGSAVRNLQGMYDTLDDNVNQTQQQIDDISWTLQQCEQASFGLLEGEAPVEAVPANWKKLGDKDGVEGVLFLTDQRLIFEQKEEVATKKVLFFATEKQKVQSLAWAVPVAEIEKAVGSSRGFMGKDDFLTVTLPEGRSLKDAANQPLYDNMGRPQREVEIHLKGEKGEAWQAHIGRVKSGEIARERTVPVAAAAEQAVTNAPTKCTTCGATLSGTIVRGQKEITCEYCGSVMRL